MKKHKLSLVIAGFGSLLALVLALLSTSQHVRLQSEGFLNPSFCAISERINCDIVNASSYSEMFGVPIAWWGVAFYSFILILAIITFFSKKESRSSAAIGWFASCLGLGYSIFLAYIAMFVLNTICIECLGMYLGTILAWIGFFPSLEINIMELPKFIINYIKSIFSKKSNVGFPLKLGRYIGLAGTLFLAVAISYPSIAGNKKNLDSKQENQIVKSFIETNPTYNIKISPNWPVWGNPKAMVTIIEFSEFQCPYCKLAALNVRPYLHEFKDKIRYYFVNFPLDANCNAKLSRQMHPYACMAAAASSCAKRFGDFWGYHDEVFRNSRKINKQFFIKLASEYGWDPREFETCMDDPSTKEIIKKDILLADKLYINGTPTILINGKKFRYWRNKQILQKVIREEIKKTSSK